MTPPTIHLNGTSAESLIEAYTAAYDALEVAYEAMKATYPNNRDFYVQGEHAIDAAIFEHRSRLQKIDDLKAGLDMLIGSIMVQSTKSAGSVL